MSKASDQFDPELFRLRPDNLSRLPVDAPPAAQTPHGASTKAKQNVRSQRLSAPFIRLPVSWFTSGAESDPRPALIDSPRARLFMLILHESRFGQRPVALTSRLTDRVGISRQNKWRILKGLERDRWVTIQRDGRRAVSALPIAISG